MIETSAGPSTSAGTSKQAAQQRRPKRQRQYDIQSAETVEGSEIIEAPDGSIEVTITVVHGRGRSLCAFRILLVSVETCAQDRRQYFENVEVLDLF